MPEYKSRDELEEEDWERYRKRQEDIYQRRQAKFEAEGHKCKQGEQNLFIVIDGAVCT